jgi:hypothetical protein
VDDDKITRDVDWQNTTEWKRQQKKNNNHNNKGLLFVIKVWSGALSV